MNSANLYKGIGKIFLSGFNHEHAVNCPMYLNDVVILNKQTRIVYSFIPERVFQETNKRTEFYILHVHHRKVPAG